MIKAEFLDLPNHISGFTVFNLMGEYKIILNSRLDYDRQATAYEHEVAHIKNNHIGKEFDCDSVEIEVRKLMNGSA